MLAQFKKVAEKFAALQQFTCHFIHSNFPHFGGIFEAEVKSIKH
jgi:hypothetical protein